MLAAPGQWLLLFFLGPGSYQSCRPVSSMAMIQPASKLARLVPRLSRAHAKSSSFVAGFGWPGVMNVFSQSAQRRRRSCASANAFSRVFIVVHPDDDFRDYSCRSAERLRPVIYRPKDVIRGSLGLKFLWLVTGSSKLDCNVAGETPSGAIMQGRGKSV